MKLITSNIIVAIHGLINICQALTPCYSMANNDKNAQPQSQELLSYCRTSEAIMRSGQTGLQEYSKHQDTGEEVMGKNLEFSFLGGGKRIGSNKIESSQEIQIQRDWSFQNWK